MLNQFHYAKPESLEEALSFLDENPDTKILAGGTDLIIKYHRGRMAFENLVDIKAIPELSDLTYKEGEGLFVGAAVKVNELCTNDIVREKYAAIAEAADDLASFQIRNRATLVGNICNASPGADLAPPLLVYDAEVHIASSEGTRVVKMEDFFEGPGRTVVAENEIVVGVSIPDVGAKNKSLYLRNTRIKGHDLCNVGIGFRITDEEKLQLAIGAVSATPLRLREIEEAIEGKELDAELIEWISEEVKKYMAPRDSSIRSSPAYRYHVAGVLVRRGLTEILEKGAN